MYFGVHRGHVVDATELVGRGRMRVTVPAIGVMTASVAPVCSSCNGTWSAEVGDEVVVAFEHGDPARPIVIGMIQSSSDAPPTQQSGPGTGLRPIPRAIVRPPR
jgi:hypothetical protein